MRINPLGNCPPNANLAEMLALKATGIIQTRTSKEAIDRAIKTIKRLIEVTAEGVEAGLGGEPTAEDLQRCHELKALLEDLP